MFALKLFSGSTLNDALRLILLRLQMRRCVSQRCGLLRQDEWCGWWCDGGEISKCLNCVGVVMAAGWMVTVLSICCVRRPLSISVLRLNSAPIFSPVHQVFSPGTPKLRKIQGTCAPTLKLVQVVDWEVLALNEAKQTILSSARNVGGAYI